MSSDRLIYHITPLSELRAGTDASRYASASLADEGFVHCAGSVETVLAVAADYFADVTEVVVLLEVEVSKLRSRCVFEAPAPRAGGSRDHLKTAVEFPHVYGPIDLDAIRGVGGLGTGNGHFAWPDRFSPLGAWLRGLTTSSGSATHRQLGGKAPGF